MGKKYIIELEDEPFEDIDANRLWRVKGFKSLVFDKNGLDKLTLYDDAEQRGAEKAWKLARWCFKDASDSYLEMAFPFEWNHGGYRRIADMPYIQAAGRYETWMKRNEINVGDEVKLVKSNEKAVVVKTEIDAIHGLSKYDEKLVQAYWLKSEVAKTGRHFPEVAELLKKIGGE